jgi:hypothetical protein
MPDNSFSEIWILMEGEHGKRGEFFVLFWGFMGVYLGF